MTAWEVAVEVGFGSGPYDPSPTWVDVTDHMWGADDGPEIHAVRGRPPDSGGITAGTLDTVVDNTTGVFDPENSAGPFYGNLDPFTPIRVLAGPTGGPLTPIWRGAVDSWPIIDTADQAVVEIGAVDLFGVLAQGSAPATAFDAAVRSLPQQPDQWWRPGPTGWEDQITGVTARHTAALEEMEPLVNGDEGTWGQQTPEGVGHTTNPAVGVTSGGPYDWSIISVWVQLVPAGERPLVDGLGLPAWIQIVRCDADFTGDLTGMNPRIAMTVDHKGVAFRFTTTDGRMGWSTENPSELTTLLMDGQRHHLLAAGRPEFAVQGTPPPNVGGQGWLWIDGRPIPVFPEGDSGPFAPGTTSFTWTNTTIGDGYRPYQGVIDHVQIWGQFPGTDDNDNDQATLGTVARTLFTAGRHGWANQSLNRRVTALVTAMGAGDMLDQADRSGIVTLQSYRPADPLKLLQEIEDTEQGQINLSATGAIRFWSRQWAWRQAWSVLVRAAFTDEPEANWGGPKFPMLPEGLIRSRDIRKIVTTAQVTSTFGRMQTVQAPKPIRDRYGNRGTIHLSGLLHRSDAESRAIAEWIIATRSRPRTQVEQIAFSVDDRPDDLLWLAQVVDLGHRIAVERNGETIEGHVTEISHHWSTAGWVVTLSLDSTRTDTTWFRWNDSEWDNTDNEGWSF